ncbi:MAG: ferritin family protein [Candidatus Alcyoniella australis]|nr:ferritin family protein [Candidatus Alcyoniella australis]
MSRQIAKGLTSLEILGVAVKAEHDAARFYTKFADRVRNPMTKSKFKTLASQERGHEKLLLQQYRRASGEDRPPVPDKYQPEIDFKVFDELETKELLKIAIRMEKDARQLYSEAAARSVDPSARTMLEYLADFEHGHQRQLESELRFITRDPDLYDKEAILIHVGP